MKNRLFILSASLLLFFACSKKQYVYKAPVVSRPVIDTNIVFSLPRDTISNVVPYAPHETYYFFVPPKMFYDDAFEELKSMLEGEQELSFKRAVFNVENAYLENLLDYDKFSNHFSYLAGIATEWSKLNRLKEYKYADSTNTLLNAAIFHTLTDTIYDKNNDILNVPYVYDFNDCFAKEEWTNMFVSKLLVTHKGNCHSLPFLYKLVAEELKLKVWLSFTPNHIYLRNWCKKTGWYNTEMTSAMFPNEAWIMTSGYVSVNSIVSGIYMDTLGLKQSVVVCLNDLAKGYLRKFKNPDLQFVLNCCDLGLKYFPNYAELLLLKAETHKKIYQGYLTKYGLNIQNPTHSQYEKVNYHSREMNKSYDLLAQYDYREIPEEMFLEWIKALENNREKYEDKRINNTFKTEKNEN